MAENDGDPLMFLVRVALSIGAFAAVIFPEGASTALGFAFLAGLWGIDWEGHGE